jgi:tetratricopeptide (TPR) repeat protein
MATSDLSWCNAILFVGIPAFFGGILQVAHELTYGSQHRPAGGAPPKTKWASLIDVIIGGLFGVGGGAAVILAAILFNKNFDMKRTDENELYLVVLGVVAGFVGYRILPAVARGLEERMVKTEKESHIALDKAIQVAKDVEIALKKAENAVRGAEKAQKMAYITYLIEKNDYKKAEKYLLDLRKNDRLDFSIYSQLSNLYKRKNDYTGAIDLTNQHIEDLRAANMGSDEAYTKALYNRACYTTLRAFSSGHDEVLLAKALDDLRRAIGLNPELRELAWSDDDFEKLRKERNPRFAEIVGREYLELTGGDTGKS